MKLNAIRTNTTCSARNLLLGLLFLCGLLTGVAPQSIIDIGIIAICALLLFNGNLIFAYPFMLLYYSTFGLVFGISTYRIFSLMLLFERLLQLNKNASFPLKFVSPILVYLLYLITVMTGYSVQRTIFTFIDILCTLIIVGKLRENIDDTNDIFTFFRIYVIVCLCSIVSGISLQNSLAEQHVMEEYTVYRFSATLNDPNYMGFFMTAAVFSTVSLKLFKPITRWIVVGTIYIAILASASMTAIVVNIILWPVYLVVSRKINIKTLIVCAIVIACALGVYQYGLENPDTPVIGSVSYRIQEKLTDWEAGDISGVTTKRSELTKAHWEYFLAQPIWAQLFGGTASNSIFISENLYGAAHNEYVDLLLNVGIIGTFVLLFYMIYGALGHLKQFRQTNDETSSCLFMIKCVWLCYAATLTMFLDFRFMLPFFI